LRDRSFSGTILGGVYTEAITKVGIPDEQGFNDESRSYNNPDGINCVR
jgi:hypothetical protein